MKILHVVQSAEGADWLYLLAREQKQLGHEVVVVAPRHDGELVRKLRSAGIAVDVLPVGGTSLKEIPRLLFGIAQLALYIRRRRFDVVHYSLFISSQIGRLAAWFARVPARVSMCAGPFYLEEAPYRWIERLTARFDDRVICSCDAIKREYARYLDPDRLATIYAAMDPSRYEHAEDPSFRGSLGIPESAPLIGLVAYFYQKKAMLKRYGTVGIKGHEFFIQAAALVHARYPEAHFIIVGDEWRGDGSYRRSLEQLSDELGLAKVLTFTGFRKDIPVVLAAMDVGVQASLTESVGGAAEGLLAGKPMVATRVGGFPDVIHDRLTGLLVDPAEPRQMADAIIYMLEHRDEAIGFGERGRALANDLFDARKVAQRVLALYASVLETRSRWRYAAGSPIQRSSSPHASRPLVS